jgi:GH24 family phage-related lysozyme (muramidase)
MTILEKLNAKYPSSPMTPLANAGDWSGAAEQSARLGMWGLWMECRNQAGLPSDDAARAEVIAGFKASKKAKFNR